MSRTPERAMMAVHAAVAVTLLGLVATVALAMQPPAPPGIAEFAPQAGKAISKAPPNLASTSGDRPGACAGGGPCASPSPRPSKSLAPTPTPTHPVKDGGATTFQCYTWPDGSVTQTFDPQSPPCVAGWADAKGNGGATSRGVDANTIRVAAPEYTGGGSGAYRRATLDILRFFNTHYELYGRKFELVDAPANGSRSDPAVAAATARQIATLKVFAAMELDAQGDQRIYRDTLAEHGIVSVTNIDATLSDAELTKFAPYVWSFAPTIDYLERSAAAFACSSLAGNPAVYAGSSWKDKPRKYAVLIEDNPAIASRPLLDALAACGIRPQIAHFTNPDSGNGPTCEVATPADVQTQMLSLRNDNVTTIIPLENEEEGIACLHVAAEQLAYQPEWFIPDVAAGIFDGGAVKGGQTNQLRHTFGLTLTNKPPLSLAEAMHYQAIKAVDPTFETTDRGWFQLSFYNQMMVLASGVQAAGPNLTPQSFHAALSGLAFPNPGAKAAPFWQATVGFGGGRTTMIRDVGMWWYDDTQPHSVDADMSFKPHGNTTVDQGGRCFAERGARWDVDEWPKNLPLFAGTCR